jgi:DNA-binding transcriptional LysR family regulator
VAEPLNSRNLNLLPVFIAIADELNLSHAAKRLNLTQPALSHALQRLRDEFDDPLFVRNAHGLSPTARAMDLAVQVREALQRVEACYRSGTFDLKKIDRRLTLASTTYFELRILKTLLKLLDAEAPLLRLDCLPLSGEFPAADLQSGRIDLAVAAYFKDLPDSFRQMSLSREDHVCLVAKRHRYLKARNRLADYLEAEHLIIAVPPGQLQKVDVALAAVGKERKIGARISNFMTPPMILEASDFILTCPKSLAENYCSTHKLSIAPAPIEIPPVEVKMVWHERTHADPLCRWFRGQIQNILK